MGTSFLVNRAIRSRDQYGPEAPTSHQFPHAIRLLASDYILSVIDLPQIGVSLLTAAVIHDLLLD